MIPIERAGLSDRDDVLRLISEYHSSEGLRPIKKTIAMAVDQHLRDLTPGLLLVARDGSSVVGVATAVSTLPLNLEKS